MSDSEGSKSKRIPSWQLEKPPESPENTPPQISGERSGNDEARQSLLKSAAKFLEDKDIRDAPVERKKSFLDSKGLTEDEIQSLLQNYDQEQHTPEAEVMEDYGIEKEIQQLQASTPNRIREPAVPADQTIETSSSSPSASEKDETLSTKATPPIITYPEFLLHSQKPPPLITARRLMITLYVASGVAATVYGTSKYLVEPMIESLTSARHSLAETVARNLQNLNLQLENAVSKSPEALVNHHEEPGSDSESIDSDPSRFFNRSAGTQTSPQRSRSPSSTMSDSSTPSISSHSHESTLLAIQSKLSGLQSAETVNPVKDSISDLQRFLDDLPQSHAKQGTGKLWEKAKPDEYGKLKAEIRGVKGVLLSARNFPSSASVR